MENLSPLSRRCRSNKCGHECRQHRKWQYEVIEEEGQLAPIRHSHNINSHTPDLQSSGPVTFSYGSCIRTLDCVSFWQWLSKCQQKISFHPSSFRLFLTLCTLTSVFKDNMPLRIHKKTIEIVVYLNFLLVYNKEPDPDPYKWLPYGFRSGSFRHKIIRIWNTAYLLPWCVVSHGPGRASRKLTVRIAKPMEPYIFIRYKTSFGAPDSWKKLRKILIEVQDFLS